MSDNCRERMKQVAEQQQQQKAKRGFLKSIIRPQ